MDRAERNNHPLTLAARYNDAASEDTDLQTTVENMGLDFEVLMHVAEQRAMRLVLIRSGRLGEIQGLMKTGAPINFTAEQRRELQSMTMLYIDAICLGWKAHDIDERS